MNRNHRKTIRAIHRATLLERLQHRIEVARRNGDQTLLHHLETEAKYLKR